MKMEVLMLVNLRTNNLKIKVGDKVKILHGPRASNKQRNCGVAKQILLWEK